MELQTKWCRLCSEAAPSTRVAMLRIDLRPRARSSPWMYWAPRRRWSLRGSEANRAGASSPRTASQASAGVTGP
ncbi:MAG TPA: hypothetical protein VFP69_11280 [Streptomyces sp.]|nr:hypothetical protein [Streptomyces sp.]